MAPIIFDHNTHFTSTLSIGINFAQYGSLLVLNRELMTSGRRGFIYWIRKLHIDQWKKIVKENDPILYFYVSSIIDHYIYSSESGLAIPWLFGYAAGTDNK